MTEFTSEFIAETRETIKQISPLPWYACSCGKCGMISGDKELIATATRGNWGDDYPIIKPVGGSIGGQYEVVMEQITCGHIPPETGNANAQYIAEACTNYPKALDHIEQLQKRVQELEIYNKNFHLACINSLDLHRESDVPKLKDIPKIIDELKARVQELEQEQRWIHQDKTMIAKKDGDSWCFVLPDFVNLHESEAEFVDGILYRFIEEIYKRLLPPKEEK